ncbi:unnamed protein product [Colletotrichum noveboracense]|uniref:Uncharacterized protein n=1 Tax=Colletotrichum noveboracense TaxID=2664923 RepID=A0A9W4RS54_9PEZI|nr:unnamed protein product [Colletotrichum noveboracense]
MSSSSNPDHLNDEDAMCVDSPVEQQSPSGMANLMIEDDLNAGEPMCLDEPET